MHRGGATELEEMGDIALLQVGEFVAWSSGPGGRRSRICGRLQKATNVVSNKHRYSPP